MDLEEKQVSISSKESNNSKKYKKESFQRFL